MFEEGSFDMVADRNFAQGVFSFGMRLYPL